MASKTNSRDTSTTQDTDLNAGLNAGTHAVADITRQQMASTATTACAMLRAMDTFQQTQQHMIQRAALLQEQTADRLRSANSAAELMAINSTVLLSSFSELAQYAQELMLASLKAQSEFMRPAEQQQQAASSTASAAAPLFQAWQSVFTAPMYAAGSTFTPRHH
ncbi:MAG: hypothetical protein RIS88_1209 [Pseudomonadota bacterium]|jgi:hypothetical protein